MVGPRKYRYHSPLISAEWCAFTNVPWGRGLINFEPQEEALAMETYATWARLFELQRYYSWIVDRFHLSTLVYQRRAHGREYDFRWLEERLLPLGFRLSSARARPESFAAGARERLKVSGNPGQYDDLAPFIAEQEEMRLEVRALAAAVVRGGHLRRRRGRRRRSHRRLARIHGRTSPAVTLAIESAPRNAAGQR